MAFGDSIKSSSIKENWLFDFYNQSGASLFLSFSDAVYNSNFYYGVITNNPNIRESIDLKTSKARSSNISITIPNFEYQDKTIAEELFGGSNNYINRDVKVYSKINTDTPNLIANFKLTDMSLNTDTITLSLESHKPWQFISFPQNKHPDHPVYEPTVYGDFTPASNANVNSNAVESAYGTVYPVPVLYQSSDSIYALMPRSYTTSDNAFLHKDVGFNQYLPLRLSPAVFTSEGLRVDSITSTSIDNSGLNILKARKYQNVSGTINQTIFDGYITTAPSSKEIANQKFSNQQNMFKRTVTGAFDDTKVATALFNTQEQFHCIITTPPKEMHFDNVNAVLFRIKLSSVSNPQNVYHQFFSAKFDGTLDNLRTGSGIQRAYSDSAFNSGTGAYSTGTGVITFNDSPSNKIGNFEIVASDEILVRISSIASAIFETYTMNISSLQLYFRQTIPYFDGASPTNPTGEERYKQEDNEFIQSINTFYCGGNGLKASWSGTPDISYIHEAHRDLLIRFAGMGTSDPTGWSDLNSAKSWKLRYWQLEPVELKRELEKLQYEGGFIFRYKQGDETQPEYIYIKDSYSDTTYEISKRDLSKVTITPDSYNDLMTKADINYQKHPSENGHLVQSNSENSSTRSTYNIDAKENIVSINLDAYVLPEIPSSPSSDPNDDFYTYYNHIYGDIKLNISGTIVNPKFYSLDVGETIEFFDMQPSKAFNKSFTNIVFMVTSISRSVGEIKFTAREVGTIS
jgi:hypothetical protein